MPIALCPLAPSPFPNHCPYILLIAETHCSDLYPIAPGSDTSLAHIFDTIEGVIMHKITISAIIAPASMYRYFLSANLNTEKTRILIYTITRSAATIPALPFAKKTTINEKTNNALYIINCFSVSPLFLFLSFVLLTDSNDAYLYINLALTSIAATPK